MSSCENGFKMRLNVLKESPHSSPLPCAAYTGFPALYLLTTHWMKWYFTPHLRLIHRIQEQLNEEMASNDPREGSGGV